jgi:hypothetical protein
MVKRKGGDPTVRKKKIRRSSGLAHNRTMRVKRENKIK